MKLAVESAIESNLLVKNADKKYSYTSVHKNYHKANDEYKQMIETCKTKFFEKLTTALEITAKQLHERFEFQKKALKKQFPLLMNGMWNGSEKLNNTDTVESVINQGTLGIGFIGLAEALIALTGSHHGELKAAQELGLEIITYMRDKANEFSERYQHNYSILATPAEGLSGKFTKRSLEKLKASPTRTTIQTLIMCLFTLSALQDIRLQLKALTMTLQEVAIYSMWRWMEMQHITLKLS